MMNRKFTAREAWLLLLLSVMLLALFYYLALYRPVNLEVERCAALQVPVEEDLELQMMKATRKKKMVDELENAPEKQQGELLPYNNIKNEITDLYEALSPAATYNLSFSEAVASGNIHFLPDRKLPKSALHFGADAFQPLPLYPQGPVHFREQEQGGGGRHVRGGADQCECEHHLLRDPGGCGKYQRPGL